MNKNKKVILLTNTGFCYGVSHSIKLVDDIIKTNKYPKPIYLLNSIVHNEFVNNYFNDKGIIVLSGKSKLELLDDISNGTIIFSAHGVSDIVKEKAQAKGLTTVDATCPFVERSYQLIKEYLNNGYHLLYIGKKNHPETEAVLSFSSDITLVTDDNFEVPSYDKIAIAHQTTMSDYDVKHIYDYVVKKNDKIVIIPMICNATKLRQEELKNTLEKSNLDNTLVIIVGDKASNNCTKLYELGLRYTNNCIFIDSYESLDDEFVKKFDNFIISSGTSTPLINVINVKKYLLKEKIKKNISLKDYINK